MSAPDDRPVVIVSESLPDGWLAPIEASCEVVVGLEAATEDQRDRARALLTMLTVPVDGALLDRFPALTVVSNMAVGVDNVDVEACSTRGIAVGNTPGVLTDATADLTWALLLASARRLEEAARDAREGRWKTWSPTGWLGADLRAATLGVVGMGKIGYAVAERARGFGMRLLYNSRSRHPEAEAELGAEYRELEALLSESDFVSLHCPLTPQTRHLIDAPALGRMKPTAHLINTSRGPVVDQDALLAALTAGQIGGAALDVTDPEPLPPEHPLYAAPRCLVIPHIGSATHGTRRRMALLACENVLAGLAGEPLPHCVNPS
jgi:lactate dehydrogenase-like 2-hydroxyacid dehydrogenase